MATPPADTSSPRAPLILKFPSLKRPDIHPTGHSIAFLIGPNATESSIHKNLACASSPVLAAALNGPYLEAQTRTYSMSHVEPHVFEHLVQWIYTGETGLHLAKQLYLKPLTNKGYAKAQRNISAAVQLWVLGEELLMRPLQNVVMKDLTRWWEGHQVVLMEQVKYVYENTGEGSRLRQFMVAVGDRCIVVPEPVEPYPEEFLRDVRALSDDEETAQKSLFLRFLYVKPDPASVAMVKFGGSDVQG